MRGKKAFQNAVFSLIEETISVICGFILPRLILSAYGSTYNGLINSITQFLACAVLLRSGIGGATRAALYKPIAEENHDEINSIIRATDIFMKKIALILVGLILFFASIYPILTQNEFDWFFTFTLFLIIGASTFAESFFGITYLIVLQADQKLWIASLLKCICYILNTIIGATLILNNFGIHVVKLGSALVYVAYPIVLGLYVRHAYKINKNVKPNNKAIAQRWDAFWHQVAIFVMNSTDIMLLTIFRNMLEVSVYSVYNMVIHGLKRGIIAFSNGLEAAFGNMFAKKEEKVLSENVAIIETIIYGIATIVYTCALILILDFVKIYTKGINDINYIRPIFAFVIILAQYFNSIRIPYQLVVQAAGHYKQTKMGAIIEPIINITLSIIFILKFGMVGVAIGTLTATIFRTLQYSLYMSKNIVKRNWFVVPFRCVISFGECALTIIIIKAIGLFTPNDYGMWFVKAIITGIITVVIVLLGSFIFFNADFRNTYHKIWGIAKKK